MKIYYVLLLLQTISACTNLLVSKGASIEGSNTITYNADASNFYGSIYHYPASVNNNSTAVRKLWSWDFGTYLGEIPEAVETYNVVGNINEWGLIITESTFGGLVELSNSKREGLIDYGSLIWVTLQRSKTARDAITLMGQLVEQYGYASTGESFSIADQNELWYMELIGKGKFEKGAVWVARKVPNGYISGHANQARITTFPLNDSENTLFSSDVISFARKIHLYQGSDHDFSFSDVYDPVTFSGARFCEARVWSLFSTFMGSDWSNQYLDYAQGYNLTNRMPLWVKPSNKINLENVIQSMRSHYEGTALDTTGTQIKDVGAGAFNTPIRATPNTWSTDTYPGNTYFNERSIAGPFSGWSIICQSRSNMPKELAAVMWYGVDDSSTNVHFPVYGSSTKISPGWAGAGPQDGATPPMTVFNPRNPTAFWAFNLVANYAYTRWNEVYPDVYSVILSKESEYKKLLAINDENALNLYNTNGKDAAVQYATEFSFDLGNKLLEEWIQYFGDLFVKYRDGYVTKRSPAPVCGCSTSSTGYTQSWYDRIVQDTGDLYLEPKPSSVMHTESVVKMWKTIDKLDLTSLN